MEGVPTTVEGEREEASLEDDAQPRPIGRLRENGNRKVLLLGRGDSVGEGLYVREGTTCLSS